MGVDFVAMPFSTKARYVYERLRGQILDGEIRPGERLVLRKVAEMAGTSLLPAREAIQRLEADGLVTMVPYVGATIVVPDIDRIEEILLIRGALERLGIEVTARLMREEDFDELEEIVRESERALEHQDVSTLSRVNRAFHLSLFKRCPMPRLKKLIEDLWDESFLATRLLQFIPKRAKDNITEHRRIVRYLRNGKVARAEALNVTQRERARRELRKSFNRALGKEGENSPPARKSSWSARPGARRS